MIITAIVSATLGALACYAITSTRRPPPAVPDPETQEAQERDRRSVRELKTFIGMAQARGQGMVERARTAVARSTVDMHLAEAVANRARDESPAAKQAQLYRRAYEARTRESLALWQANDCLFAAHIADSTAIALGKGALLITEGRLAAIDGDATDPDISPSV